MGGVPSSFVNKATPLALDLDGDGLALSGSQAN